MIKKHPSKNEYYYSGNNIWVRNFTNENVIPFDINDKLLTPEYEIPMLLSNEIENSKKLLQRIDTEDFNFKNIVIVSGGYQFLEKQKLLDSIQAIIIGTNTTLKLWNVNKKMHFYVINNPYKDCMDYLPKNLKTLPKCIASTRTYPEFINTYPGVVYEYTPVKGRYYSGLKSESDYFIDDYRNSICAAIGLAYKFKVKKLLLLCCDNASDKEKSGMVKVNDFWMYPQHKIAHNIIDANLYWLKSKNIAIKYHSIGMEFKNAEYIENIQEFMNE